MKTTGKVLCLNRLPGDWKSRKDWCNWEAKFGHTHNLYPILHLQIKWSLLLETRSVPVLLSIRFPEDEFVPEWVNCSIKVFLWIRGRLCIWGKALNEHSKFCYCRSIRQLQMFFQEAVTLKCKAFTWRLHNEFGVAWKSYPTVESVHFFLFEALIC